MLFSWFSCCHLVLFCRFRPTNILIFTNIKRFYFAYNTFLGVLLTDQPEDRVAADQRRQSGLKSGVVDPGQNNFNFFQAIKKIRFSRQIFKKFRFGQAILARISIFQAQIGHLPLLLGKLFYFFSKVNFRTYSLLPVHDN